jgi:hypothetical protein
LVRQLQVSQLWFYMGNDDLCKVIGIRNIKINILKLNCNGFNLKSEGVVLKMSKGVMIVMKG